MNYYCPSLSICLVPFSNLEGKRTEQFVAFSCDSIIPWNKGSGLSLQIFVQFELSSVATLEMKNLCVNRFNFVFEAVKYRCYSPAISQYACLRRNYLIQIFDSFEQTNFSEVAVFCIAQCLT